MKKLFTLIFSFVILSAYAQEKKDSVNNSVNTTIDSLSTLRTKIDDVSEALKYKKDSLRFPTNDIQKLDSLKSLPATKLNDLSKALQTGTDTLKLPTDNFSKLDSIKQNIQSKTDSIENRLNNPLVNLNPIKNKVLDARNQAITNKLDSLRKIDPELLNLDSAQLATKTKIDSLQNLQLPHEKYVKKLDSLQNTYTDKVNQKVASLEQKAKEKIENVKNKIIGNVDGAKDLNIDTPDLPDLEGNKIPGTNTSLDLSNTNTDLNLPNKPDTGLPSTDIGLDQSGLTNDLNLGANLDIDTDLALKDQLDTDIIGSLKDKTNIDKYADKLGEVKDAPKEKMDKIKEADEIKGVTDKLGKAKEIGGELEGYQDELDKIKEGNYEDLEKRAEEQAKNFKEVEVMKQQSAEFDKLKKEQEEYKKQMEQYQDTEFIEEKAKEVIEEAAVEHFAEHQGVLKSAQTKLLAYKGKYTSLPSIKNIPKRKPNPYTGKSLKERLAPGFQIEVQRSNYTGIDLAPFVGYKFNGRLAVYGGYLYRFTFNNEEKSFIFEENTKAYGPRVFANYEVYKGFFATLAFDRIRTSVPRAFNISESSSQWVHGGYVGIGRQYKFAKKIHGSIQGLFNFLHDDESPYQKKLNLRMGFELEWKKKARSRRKSINP